MKEKIKKIDAAQRQLDFAIKTWFQDGDAVVTHILACSAYQIIHDINQSKKNRDLLLDTVIVKDEFRHEFISIVKSSYNFFKHADKDPNPDGFTEFDSLFTELFIFFSIAGLELLGIKSNIIRNAFVFYITIHKPHLRTKKFDELSYKNIPSQQIDEIRSVDKNQFFEYFSLVWSNLQ